MTNYIVNQEISDALKRVEAARNKLDMADSPDLITAAIHELNAAEIRLNELFKTIRSAEGVN